MRRAATLAIPLALATAPACDRSHAAGDPEPPAAAGSSLVSTEGGRAASAPATDAAATSAAGTAAWRGSYRSSSAELYIPPDWKNVRIPFKESSAGIGEGALWFRIDGQTRRVLGALDGPLGPGTIEGIALDGKLAATIRPQVPGPTGFAGTLVGAVASDHGAGTMNMSPGEASAVRTATFDVAPGAASP
jgi:hypothetical protein